MYFNYSRTSTTFYDFRIFLGQGSATPQSEMVFQEQFCVAMAPEFAKTLRDNLTIAIERYESTFGEIRNAPRGTSRDSDKPKK
jgi:hypothetical protein